MVIKVTSNQHSLLDNVQLTIMRSLILVLLVFSISCKKQEDIKFIGIKNTHITGTEGHMVIVNAVAVLFNPNQVTGKVRSIDVAILYKGKEVANVSQLDKTKVPANSTFSVPLVMAVDMDKLNTDLLSQLSNILSKKGFELHFVGNVKVSIRGFGYKVPVNHKESITF